MKFFIKEAREHIGLSQKELAFQLNIKPSTFNGYETGAHDPKSDVLVLIARRCNTSVDFLLGLTNAPRLTSNVSLVTADLSIEDEQLSQLMGNYECLNDEGREKLADYADDLIQSDKYIKTNEARMGKKA